MCTMDGSITTKVHEWSPGQLVRGLQAIFLHRKQNCIK